MDFIKMQNLGNDFIFIDEDIPIDKIKFLCNRYVGVGADGVIVTKQDSIIIYNSDGSEANICGNALLCYGLLYKDKNEVRTKSKTIRIKRYNEVISINMGQPRIMKGFTKKFQGIPINIVDVGNLHVIAVVDDVDLFNLEYFAKSIQRFISANVNIISHIKNDTFRIRTYEIGAEETSACGSGITSSFFVLNKLGLVSNNSYAKTLFGDMKVYYEFEDIYLESEPKLVYKGVIDL